MKKSILGICTALFLLIMPQISYADSAVGDVIITLGKDLSAQDRQKVLNEMNAPENATIIEVTNAEEHKYLGDYIPKADIGTRAISSSSITVAKEGSGLEVKTNNIGKITDEMYLNALMTAGVKDAKVYVTAPFKVSGTAALTGLMKAYETSSDQKIPDDVKKVANEELVTTSKLGQKIGDENASALMAKVKEDIAKNGVPQSQDELEKKIDQAASELNVTLTNDQKQSLISLFDNMKNINIDWNQVGDQLNKAKDKIANFINSDEGKNFIQQVIDFFVSLWNAIVSIFTGGGTTESNG
ncbi:hypothetical protein ACH95_07055 [Bacillus glycinifermentans]|uniref:DUF1002 domain-containing protein n=2 Tax=Bacillus glycinifermentans TaxID=1664069 RepID=A0A0J6ELE3_9BACI|nr:DUF1002 domain-containing protein [Bacillus glycinifermentans]ATH92231.1 DUF1002 domain-containing protein [Bacillus glycinifermentans]KMM61341.1 hypothetical protein ACH95_07055 [Bacillus glycinifermentans]KRT94980.1 hypothetical protein AB447_210615 [Bacillus glycinifermentans]MEC0484748.1 DUF1002 domain-containing protein [Bacillus glycinifermentans]MEC0494591.1 DUF1002 domain-containing protein [Bacillus glycinifermentans]